ncbi:MAG: hypothetical protein JJ878_13895 [Alphaproteobacteria bacterium]|nr:hypothetical protein [Alphaproteobacteria bacterium]MBO6863726.1 hypothetical protein [Alphaproteobacteria bacterium]
MEALLTALAETPPAAYLRGARWGYAAVNASHILGIALLIGAVVPMNLRLLGWHGKALDSAALIPVLRPCAMAGLILAVLTGLLLFSIQPADYLALSVFQAKLALIALGTAAALWGSRRTPPAHPRTHALVSLACWIAALICGRMIAFAA